MKKNCWEVKGCGQKRGGNGKNTLKCPVPDMATSDGINGGQNAGRICWLIANTMCKGNAEEATFEEMFNTCVECDFYRLVREEEGKSMMFSIEMLRTAYEEAKAENSRRKREESKKR